MSDSLSFTHVLMAQVKRDLLLGVIKRNEWINPLVFLILVQSLFPLALGGSPELLENISPAVIWVSALLATLVSLESLFRDDFDNGSMEQMLMSPVPFYVFTFAKLICHWLLSGLPLVLVCPLLALSFGIESKVLPVMFMTLLLATPVLCCISALASALTLNARRGGVLLSLMVLPLYVPVLVFGSGALTQAMLGISPVGALYILAALFIFALSVTPFALSAALKLSLSDA